MLLNGIISLALASAALAAPATTPGDGKPTPTPTWTLVNFARTCNDAAATCQYSFGISKSVNPLVITLCAFTVQGSTGSAKFTDFQNKACADAPDFHVNGGWDATAQFITIVVTDFEANFWAFFGYTSMELGYEGRFVTPDHVNAASVFGQFRKRTDSPNPREGWQIIALERKCPDASTCDYNFNIELEDSSQVGCSIHDQSNEGPVNSFYDVPCAQDADYYISWGYDSEHDSAVMTVVQKSSDRDAFFGFDNVNNQSSFQNVGPNRVYPVGVFD